MTRIGVFGWGIVAPKSPNVEAFARNLEHATSWLEPFNGFGPDCFLVGRPQFDFADYRAWIANGMNPRRVRTARASRTGTYALPNIPAGEYLAAAIDRADDGDLQDPAFIERLSRVGTRVVVGATERTMDLVKARGLR